MTGFANSAPPTITGNRVVGGTITASVGTWTPTPGGYNYQWQRADDISGTNLAVIPGATGATYTIDPTDTSKFLRVGVYPQEPVVPVSIASGIGLCNLANWNGISQKSIWTVAWSTNSDTSRSNLTGSHPEVPLRGVYKNAIGVRTDTATAPSQAEITAWEASFGATGYLRDGTGIVPYQTTVWMVNPSNDAITDLFITNWQSEPTYGISSLPGLNFIFVDNVGPDTSTFSDRDASNVFTIIGYTGADPSLTPPTTANAWARHSQQRYARLCANFQRNGIFMAANAWGFRTDQSVNVDNSMYNPTLAWWDTVLRYPVANTLGPGGAPWRPGEPIFDAYLIEYWIVHSDGHCRLRSDQTPANSRDYWGERMDAMLITQNFLTSGAATPRAFFGLTTATGNTTLDTTAARFGRASFLTRWNRTDNSAHIYNGYTDPSLLANQADGDIGTPAGAPYELSAAGVKLKTHTGRFTGPGLSGGKPVSNFASTTSLIVREYTNGYAIVNATSASVTVTSGRFTGITVPSGDAVIHVGP